MVGKETQIEKGYFVKVFLYTFFLFLLSFLTFFYIRGGNKAFSVLFLHPDNALFILILVIVATIVLTISTYGIIRGYISGGVLLLIAYIITKMQKTGEGALGLAILSYIGFFFFLIFAPVAFYYNKLYLKMKDENPSRKWIVLVGPFIILFIILIIKFITLL